MAKQLNVNLAFQADTSGAKQQIQSLIAELNKLSSGAGIQKDLPITKEILEAQNAAKQLGFALESALNTNTGKLDLTAFNQSLKQSGMTLEQYSAKLTMLGQTGDRAFLQVAQSIVNTQAPLRRSNKMLTEFATTLKNTARWQISSSILHGFMGAIQSANGYAQDLNESLNNIRIVTGQNIDQMAEFAEQANKAAKALSTTTTEYTNAALIYYQQGDDDSTVLKKTDVTTKMANVTGQSAEVVSDQLTAIWNNFNKSGEESYEKYADVLTALGAATASSTDEIAGGLEKFASIADMIGLSYDYAATALATITATTRQSEDVVGTALKTIFARIQGLNLGETLDDGTTLNKYSEALNKVGVSIYDQAGGLKEMDTILDEIGSKWQTLSKDSQVALAQTVAGVRQYNQLVSLMDNWDYFGENLSIAQNSTGVLDEQAEIYAESWEASKDRVTASLEEIYATLMDEDFFIGLNDGLTVVIGGIGDFIDSIGGVKGVLLLLSTIITRVFSNEISTGINNAIQNMRVFSGVTQTETAKIKQSARDIALSMTKDMDSVEIDVMRQALSSTYENQEKLRQSAKSMSADQLTVVENVLKTAQSYNEMAISLGKAADEARRLYEEQLKSANASVGQNANNQLNVLANEATDQVGANLLRSSADFIAVAQNMNLNVSEVQSAFNNYSQALRSSSDDQGLLTNNSQALITAMNALLEVAEQSSTNFQSFQGKLKASADVAAKARSDFNSMKESISAKTFKGAKTDIETLANSLEDAGYDVRQFKKQLSGLSETDDLSKAFVGIEISTQDMNKAIINTASVLDENGNKIDNITPQMRTLAATAGDVATKELSSANAIKMAGEASDKASMKIKNTGLAYKSLGSAIGGGLQGLSSFAMGLTSIKSAFDTLKDPDLGTFEKFTSILMSLGMGIPMIVSSFTSLGNVIKFVTSSTTDGLTAQLAYSLGMTDEALKTNYLVVSKEGLKISRYDNAAAAAKEAAATEGATVVTEIETAAVWKDVAGQLALKLAKVALAAIIVGALVGAIYLAVKAYNADAEAAKKAAEASEELSEKAEEAAQNLEKITSSFDNYNNLVDALNECTKGTQEWNDALKAVNNEVLNIMKNNPELAKQMQVERNADGMLTIKNQDEILAQAEKMANSASYAASMGAVTASQAQLKSNTTDLRRDVGTYAVGYAQDSAVYYNAGSVIAEHYQELAGLTAEEFEAAVRELTAGAKEMYGATDHQYEQMINSLMGYQGEIDNLAVKANEAALQLENMANMIAEEQLGDEYDATAKEVASEAYEAEYQKLYDEVIAQGKSGINIWSGKNDDEVKKFWNRYSEATGTNFALSGNAVQGTDGNRYFEYLDNGEKKTISLEEAAAAIAATEALTEMGVAAEKAANIVDNLATAEGKAFAAGLANSKNELTGEFETANYLQGFTQETIEQIQQGMTDALASENGEINQSILDIFGLNQTEFDALAELYGLTGAELMQALLDGATEALDSLTQAEIDNLGYVNTSNMTVAEQKQFVANKQSVYDQFDAAGTFAGLNLIEQQNADSAQNLNDFYSALSGVNLKAEDATAQVEALAKEFDLTGSGIDWLIDNVDSLDKQFNVSAASINEQAASLKEVIDGLNTGDTISAEDIAKLEEAGIDTSDYFSQMADGSYMLTVAAEDFKGIVESITFEQLKDQIDDFGRAKEQAATGKWFDKYLTDTSVVEGSYKANSTGNRGYVGSSADELGRARLDYIDQFEAESFDFNEEQLQLLSDYQANPELELTSDQLQQIADMIDIVNQKQSDLQSQIFTTATSLTELDAIAKELGAYDYQAYADGLINLASQYENCGDEIEEFQVALMGGSEAAIKAAEDNLRAATVIGEAAEKYDLEAEVLEAQADRLAKAYGISAEAAANMAVKNQRMNKGVSSLVDNWKDWKKQLNATDKLTEDYAEAVVDCTKAIADLVGASEDLELPDEFFNTENMALLEKAAQGDVEAINALGAEVAYFTVDALTFNEAFAALASDLESFNGFDVSNIDLSNVLNAEQFAADKDLVLQGISDIKNGLIAEGQGMTDDWVAALNRMAITTGMSVEEMNGLLGSLGVQAKVETTYVKQPMELPTYSEQIQDITYREVPRYETDETGEQKQIGVSRVPEYRKVTIPGPPVTVEGYAAVAQISTEDNPMTLDIESGGTVTPAGSGSSSGAASYSGSSGRGSVAPSAKTGSGNSGGGGEKKPASKIETTKKDDVVDRYKELEDSIDDVADAMEDAAKEADRLYGKARIDKIKQQNGYLQQEIGLLKDKIAAAKQYLAIDKATLDTAASKAGVSFVYDEAGNLTNYTAQMEQLYNELRAAQDAWNADYQNKTDEEQQEYEENIIQPIQDKIDELKEAIAAYEETRELIEDLENEIDDKFYEWQDNNYEILHYELEIEIEINDLELEYIDYYLNKITDDFYSMAEAAQYMNDQIPVMTDSLSQYENFYNNITAAYAAGEISQAAYVEGMQESYSAILDQLSALNDLDKEMMHYYEETLAAASEELSFYTDQMEHLTAVLDHYRNIVELVNGEFDYEAIGTILTGRADTLKNELDVATENYQMLLSEQAAVEEAYRNAQTEEARELYAEELKAITTQVDEAHDLMLSKTEEWAEAQKAIMENTMAQAAHEMEMAFTNGMGFDALNDSLDRLNSYADEYLTKTNQIYETQTLINTAQKAIDKTTNEAAKARLKSYTEEIQQLQEKNKLSNLELDIAKAKYDVLLAEIALEEAQNAKSTVRLQRDSEGNFGYVYTADQEAISNAEQDLMDAQNALYNIGLEGANEYGQKILELQQQLADQLVALEEARAAGQFATEEEYYAARDKLINEYTALFTAYSEQYTTALGVDTSIQEEAWINAYDNMIDKSLDWKDKTTEYAEKCEDAYESWRDVVETESAVIDDILNDLEQEVKDVTDESDDLRDEVVNKVIPAMNTQLISVRNVTSAYAQQRAAIQQLISYYEQLTQSILAAIQAQAGLSDSVGAEAGGGLGYDPNTDYSALMMGYLAAGGEEGSAIWNELERQREAKIDGEQLTKDYYGTRKGEEGYGFEKNNTWYSDKNAVNQKLKELGISQFATGGYTSAWGPEGRLALLHEKELVLNQDDTANFLAGTQILRDIVDMIDINTLRNQVSILPYFSSQLQGISGELEQHVQIEAHFPSVTDRNEIEEAFNNLVNTASQYANRRK